MKAIAEKRTKGNWTYSEYDSGDYLLVGGDLLENEKPTGVEMISVHEGNVEFFIMAANNFDKLLNVVEAAKVILSQDCGTLCQLEKALEELEQE